MRQALSSVALTAALFASSTEVLVLPERLRNACDQDANCSSAKRQVEVRYAGGKNARLEDSRGVPRVTFGEAESLANILNEVKAWRLGREVYDAQCARCHGADGTLEDYPGVKSLAGIGKRYSEARILEAVQNGGRVDMSGMTPAERHAVALYVAGL